MANHASAKKRIRQTLKRTDRNKTIRSRVRTHVKRVRAAIAEGDARLAQASLPQAIREIEKAVTKGVYHRKTGSRYVSRLVGRVAALKS